MAASWQALPSTLALVMALVVIGWGMGYALALARVSAGAALHGAAPRDWLGRGLPALAILISAVAAYLVVIVRAGLAF